MDKHDEEAVALSALERRRPALFIGTGDRLRFTSAGVERFGARFARCGIDIRRIATRAQALAAMEASFPAHWTALVAPIAAKKPANPRQRLERECLVAIALGDEARAKGLQERIARLNAQEEGRGMGLPACGELCRIREAYTPPEGLDDA